MYGWVNRGLDPNQRSCIWRSSRYFGSSKNTGTVTVSVPVNNMAKTYVVRRTKLMPRAAVHVVLLSSYLTQTPNNIKRVSCLFLHFQSHSAKTLVLCYATGDWRWFIHRERDGCKVGQKCRVSTTAPRYRPVQNIWESSDQYGSQLFCMRFTGCIFCTVFCSKSAETILD